MPGVEKILWQYRAAGYLIFGVTNQGGIAFGYKTIEQNYQEIDATVALFGVNPFHIIRASPFHPSGTVEPYCHRSLTRKPDIGLLVLIENEIATDHGIIVDWDNSLFVGDRPEDEECAKRAGIPFKHIEQFLKEPHTFEVC